MFKTYVNASAGAGGSSGMGPISSPSLGKSAGAMNPSVMYMIGFIIAEILLVGFISKHL